MNLAFGITSERELRGVDARLVAVVRLALRYTAQDFAVHDGLRTPEEQARYVARGVSKTMDSKHLKGLAVDLVPYINGKLRWEWEPIYDIALAVRRAAKELAVPLVWGGCWDVSFTSSNESPEKLVEGYVGRRRAAGKKAFIDGPHYELKE